MIVLTSSGASTTGRRSARTGPRRRARCRPSPMPSATMPPGSASRISWSTRTPSPRPTATRWEARRPPASTSPGWPGSACRRLTIAHVRGDSGKFPERPFGSRVRPQPGPRDVGRRADRRGRPEAIDPDEIRFGPHVVSLELRNKKANARPKSRGPVRHVLILRRRHDRGRDGRSGRAIRGRPGRRRARRWAVDAAPRSPPRSRRTPARRSREHAPPALARHPRRFAQDRPASAPSRGPSDDEPGKRRP